MPASTLRDTPFRLWINERSKTMAATAAEDSGPKQPGDP